MRTIRDIAPYSLPYGIFAPAELYDFEQLQRHRSDIDYFVRAAQAEPVIPADRGEEPALPHVKAPCNILQITCAHRFR